MNTRKQINRGSIRLGWFCLSLFLATSLILLEGCLVLPVPKSMQFYGGRRIIDENDLALLIPGETTRADVLLHFGEPDLVSPDETQFAYKWYMAKAVWLLIGAGGYTAGIVGDDIPEIHLIIIEFDDSGTLKTFSNNDFIFSSLGHELNKANFDRRTSSKVNGPFVLYCDLSPSTSCDDQTGRSFVFEIGNLRDLRPGSESQPDHLGTAGYWKVEMGEIISSDNTIDVIQRLLINEVIAFGGRLWDGDPDWVLSGDLIKFEVMNHGGLFSIKAEANLHMRITLENISGNKETMTWEYFINGAGKGDYPADSTQEAYIDCLRQFQKDFLADLEKIL